MRPSLAAIFTAAEMSASARDFAEHYRKVMGRAWGSKPIEWQKPETKEQKS